MTREEAIKELKELSCICPRDIRELLNVIPQQKIKHRTRRIDDYHDYYKPTFWSDYQIL